MSTAPSRLATLDAIRGVAVLGILVANLPAFGLPGPAYFSPAAWGGAAGADRAVWALNLVLVEGKMRGLFSLLFGASLLLVVQRARAAGQDAATIHYTRMAWLFVLGCAHLYLLWWGDILAHYALVGAVAFLFVDLPARWLLALGAALIGWQTLSGVALALAAFAAHPQGTPQAVATWQALATVYGVPSGDGIAREIAAMHGGLADGVAWRWHHAPPPLQLARAIGADTLALMLFGMAAIKTGLLTGAWPRARYRRWAIATLAVTLPLYAALAARTIAHDFDQRWVILASAAATVPLRPVTAIGYAALITLALRPDGRLTNRLAAAGRMAFSNYVATTLLATALFDGWGLGLFARLGRAELYWVAPVIWLAILTWSQPWLARYRYGPLEWLWRSLARWQWQPMRR